MAATPGLSDALGRGPGQLLTDSSGLQYLRARYCDADAGRFLTEDPVPFAQRYAYVGGNPVNLSDPSGQCPRLVKKLCKRISDAYHAVASAVSAANDVGVAASTKLDNALSDIPGMDRPVARAVDSAVRAVGDAKLDVLKAVAGGARYCLTQGISLSAKSESIWLMRFRPSSDGAVLRRSQAAEAASSTIKCALDEPGRVLVQGGAARVWRYPTVPAALLAAIALAGCSGSSPSTNPTSTRGAATSSGVATSAISPAVGSALTSSSSPAATSATSPGGEHIHKWRYHILVR
jgi:RHS repeat-associated protein